MVENFNAARGALEGGDVRNMFGEYPVTKIIAELEYDNLLPGILFRTSRKQCDADIEMLMGSHGGGISPAAQETLIHGIDTVIKKYGMEVEVIRRHPHYPSLVTTATGAHHAGQLLMWRLLLEELMSRGMLRLLIATGTVAAGVDFPARTVVITAHSKRGSEGFNVITSSELMQMAGRAGRRGKDTIGFCIVAPGAYSDARVIHQVTQRPAEPLRSAYFAAPATVLNLLKYRNVDDLRYTVSKSLAAYLDRKSSRIIRDEAEREEQLIGADASISDEKRKRGQKRTRRMLREADVLAARQTGLLEKSLVALTSLGYVEPSGLTEKGNWAANLCTSLVLELGEAINDHLLSDLSEEQLVGVVASIAGDPHRPYFGIKANPIRKEKFNQMQAVIDRVRKVYSNPVTSDLSVLPDAALTVLTWMDSTSWTEFGGLLRLAGVAEGDVARLVTQTADHLNQISRLEESHPDLARTAAAGRLRILKPPLTEAVLAE